MTTATQTSVSVQPPIGKPGMLYDLNEDCHIVERRAAEAIDFGDYVSISGEDCELSDSSSEVTTRQGGIALFDETKATEAGYAAGEMVKILRKGRAWVATEDQVSAGSAAFVRFSAGVGEDQGKFRSDADTADAVTPLTCYYVLAPTAALAVVEINQPGGAIGPTGVTGATGPTGPTGP